MKFGLFSILPRPEWRTTEDVYEAEIDLLVSADRWGLDSVWLAEHHFSDFGICPSPPVLAAAIAARTRRLRVGLAVSLLPFHDPVKVAEELAVLDIVSGGRLNVGIGRGGWSKEFETFGAKHEESRARVDEGLELLRRCWTEESFTFNGQFRSVSELTVYPKPIQQPYPPLYMATNSPDSTAVAAREGLIPMTSAFPSWNELRRRYEQYVPAAVAAGRSEADARARLQEAWVVRCVYVAETEAEARSDPERYLLSYYHELESRHVAHPGGFEINLGQPYEHYLNDGSSIFGTPSQVLERVKELREITGHRNLMCFMSFGGFEPAKVRRSLELFATEVAPKLA
ncbi:MAG: LLM class flavin-dependent oxidoreductase [Chloroflexi bacterium]|nr:LLM class flavin-dependent oxidoreductase [Chloroflexota bacterium]